ncbi:MarR family transcriptional regulator [Trebonia kvetii]|uniref:MarR family transcriptional regulator n=1 Tax=Trebonia kvetii TaxID=2480626 RepID=A0A6P2BWL8_9ACTN|nr:MarR family transcriptional regulator [Trebonia kvetii]TVZ02626.1 MarR family transcriptional regulator [Trebonia kvetii]
MSDIEAEVRHNAGFLIWRLSMGWRAAMDRVLEPLGLTQAQYAVLAPLYGMSRSGARPSQRELADLTGLDAVYISKLVRALERAGFVERSASTVDTRAVELTLTDQGLATVREAMPRVVRLRDELSKPLGGIDGERTRQLAEMLVQLLDSPELRR